MRQLKNPRVPITIIKHITPLYVLMPVTDWATLTIIECMVIGLSHTALNFSFVILQAYDLAQVMEDHYSEAPAVSCAKLALTPKI